jgi:hypothetical protein
LSMPVEKHHNVEVTVFGGFVHGGCRRYALPR